MELRDIALEMLREKIVNTFKYKSENDLTSVINNGDVGTLASEIIYTDSDKTLLNQLVGTIGVLWTVDEMMEFVVKIAIEAVEEKRGNTPEVTEYCK